MPLLFSTAASMSVTPSLHPAVDRDTRWLPSLGEFIKYDG
jgi:hypothetical protein